jgi:hypothetical protein
MPTLSKIEFKILRKVADSQLISKTELSKHLQNDGFSGKESRDISQMVDSATKNMVDKKLLTTINPVGSTCYIITQRGARLLQDMRD